MGSLSSVILAIVFLTSSAWADSDGYYCIGPDYVAYQFGLAQPPVAPHRVYVVRLGDEQGIADAGVLQIPQFQVGGMRCGETAIQIEALDALYTVRLDASRGPVRCEIAGGKSVQITNGCAVTSRDWEDLVSQIKGFGIDERRLLKTASGHEFMLQIVATSMPSTALTQELQRASPNWMRLARLFMNASCSGARALWRAANRRVPAAAARTVFDEIDGFKFKTSRRTLLDTEEATDSSSAQAHHPSKEVSSLLWERFTSVTLISPAIRTPSLRRWRRASK